jgi:hypothetical protein
VRHLIAPTIPIWTLLTRKQFAVGAAAVALDTSEKFIRFAGMLAPRGEYELAHVLALAPAIAATSEQHKLALMARGQTQTDRKVGFSERGFPIPVAVGL